MLSLPPHVQAAQLHAAVLVDLPCAGLEPEPVQAAGAGSQRTAWRPLARQTASSAAGARCRAAAWPVLWCAWSAWLPSPEQPALLQLPWVLQLPELKLLQLTQEETAWRAWEGWALHSALLPSQEESRRVCCPGTTSSLQWMQGCPWAMLLLQERVHCCPLGMLAL